MMILMRVNVFSVIKRYKMIMMKFKTKNKRKIFFLAYKTHTHTKYLMSYTFLVISYFMNRKMSQNLRIEKMSKLK